MGRSWWGFWNGDSHHLIFMLRKNRNINFQVYCFQGQEVNIISVSVSSSSVTEAGNQLVAQEAVRKPSMLRRPPAGTGEPISSKNSDHVTTFTFVWLLKLKKAIFCFLYFFLDCLNCSRITAMSDRLSSLEAKVWTALVQPEYPNH